MSIKLFSFDLETRTGNSKVNQVSGVLIKVLSGTLEFCGKKNKIEWNFSAQFRSQK